jgi:glycosyltransferase involved in cell wall biosynthesis
MKVSVVIPAHNEEKNIADTIRAVLAQDYPDFEVIVVDNASTDRTAEVARRFESAGKSFNGKSSGKPILKVVHEPRKGLLSARERGRKEAEGEIIINMDADCLPLPNHLSRGMKHFNKRNTVAVTGPYDYHDGHPIFRHSSLAMQRYIYRLTSAILQSPLIKKGAVLIGGNNFIRTEVLEKAGGYDTSIVFYGEDTDTAKRISPHGKIVFDPNLSIKTSARRFKAEGNVRITVKYLFHFWKTILSSGTSRKIKENKKTA